MDLKGKNIVTAKIKFVFEAENNNPAKFVEKIMAGIWENLDFEPEEFVVICEKECQEKYGSYKNN